jgi:transposase
MRMRGLSSKELAERYHVSRAWVDALKQRRRETGPVEPRKQTKFRGRVQARLERRLAALLAARPDATLTELRDALPTTAGLTTLWRAIDRLGFTVKKKRYTPTNNDALMSPRRAANGRRRSRCGTCVSTCSWMNAASRPIYCSGMAAVRRARARAAVCMNPLDARRLSPG